MIIRIRQTETGLKPRYSVESGGFLFEGERGSLHDAQRITLTDRRTTLSGQFRLPSPLSAVPLLWLFGMEQRTRVFEVSRNGGSFARVYRSVHGLGKSCCIIELNGGTVLRCYSLWKGSFDYVSVYDGDQQIALIETFLRSTEGRHDHKLYLLDEFRQHAEILCWFVLYYAQHEIRQGEDVAFAVSFSRYRSKCNPAWRETHFPEENFFGRTKPFG